MLSVNTNIAALTAQQNLNSSQSNLNVSLQRLSSGLRINSAADDPAGLQISDGFTSQINGLNQASQNANDAISLSQTADGALSQITNNLQTIRQLAVEAANGTNSASDRQALNQEVQQDISEISRVATQTSFNNQNILDGSFGSVQFQVGADVGQTIGIALTQSVAATAIGSYVTGSSTATNTPTVTYSTGSAAATAVPASAGVKGTATTGAATYAINGTSIAASATYAGSQTGQGATSAYALAAAINASGIQGVTADATNSLDVGSNGTNGTFVTVTSGAGATGGGTDYQLSINGTVVFDTGTVAGTTASQSFSTQQVADSINNYTSTTGVSASLDANGGLKLTAADGRDISLGENVTGTAQTAATAAGTVTSALSTTTAGAATDAITGGSTATYQGQVTLSSSAGVTLSASLATALGFSNTTLAAGSNLAAQNVLTVAGANNTILSVDSAIQSVDSLAASFGAIQNRFQSAIASLGTASTNLTSARSNVLDANFASETSNLTRSQILQQAGVSILAQANALPQGVLKLLQ